MTTPARSLRAKQNAAQRQAAVTAARMIERVSDKYTVPGTPLPAAVEDMRSRGLVTPCSGDRRYMSEDRHERAAAAPECAPCPIRVQCAVHADLAPERFGVWGGVDRTSVETVNRKREAS